MTISEPLFLLATIIGNLGLKALLTSSLVSANIENSSIVWEYCEKLAWVAKMFVCWNCWANKTEFYLSNQGSCIKQDDNNYELWSFTFNNILSFFSVPIRYLCKENSKIFWSCLWNSLTRAFQADLDNLWTSNNNNLDKVGIL